MSEATYAYIEVEQQGAYTELPAGASLTWAVTWYARVLPEAPAPTVGSAELVALARSLGQ